MGEEGGELIVRDDVRDLSTAKMQSTMYILLLTLL
jgi:hypothetical protein